MIKRIYYTAPALRAMLPERVTGYIWKLALKDACRDAPSQLFILVPSEIQAGLVNIAHSHHRPNLRKWHHLYAAEAAPCCISVQRIGRTYSMTLLAESPEEMLSQKGSARVETRGLGTRRAG